MHVKLIAATVILGLVTLISGPASGGESFVVNVTKAVDGEGPTGPYGVNVTCGLIVFDFEISDGETVPVSNQLAFGDECIVTETDDLGADSVTYACEQTDNTTCVDDQTVLFDQSDAGGVGTVTITNSFDPEPEPEAAAEVVEAEPTFTG